ncbi:Aste57867_25290 [Aphanomyces stellatus]|uniref:Aste57867_25290 protein n=1 Tax=Aphanomyces stellatus TaxID=120398 RepID=A0A485LXF1_9STRA|nr:hypothetical protein As57867_025212 [Aphanomyces stellatus]VFU01915.1 Aste57867_25290 [Aphanomyces stellatus]
MEPDEDGTPVKPKTSPTARKNSMGKSPLPPSHHMHHHHDHQTTPHEAKGYWDEWQARAGALSLLLSLLMQLSYVAFPAYNFSLAIWAAVHPFAHHHDHNPKGTVLFVSVLLLSCITDVAWSSLWVSGAVFFDMLCVPNQIGILHCDGLQSFPGCDTNRFVMVVFVANVALKLWLALSIWKAVAVTEKKPEGGDVITPLPPDSTEIQDAPTAIATAIPIE